MKVFLSYSFKDSELYIITLLFEQLRKNRFTVESSDFSSYGLYNDYKISSSDFFVGIITNDSESIDEVILQWHAANRHKIQTILLIEDNVHIQDPQSMNFIRFNRHTPQIAINQLLNIPEPIQAVRNTKSPENAIAAGLIVVGLAALLSILSGKSK
jgi:hypothetical protein